MSSGSAVTRLLTFTELPRFTATCRREGWTDDDLSALQQSLIADPHAGAVVRGAGGLRKVRFSPAGSGRGKSGAYRVGYVHFPAYETVVLIALFAKADRANFTAQERSAIGRLVRLLETEVEAQFHAPRRPTSRKP